MIIYVARGSDGGITHTSLAPGSTDCTEAIDSNDPEVIAYFKGRSKRLLFDILGDIQALTNPQKLNIAGDLFTGSPPKISQDPGSNVSAILCIYFNTQTSALTTADKNLAKVYCAALYTQDNPAYLVHPAFDPSINIPGDQPNA